MHVCVSSMQIIKYPSKHVVVVCGTMIGNYGCRVARIWVNNFVKFQKKTQSQGKRQNEKHTSERVIKNGSGSNTHAQADARE